MLIKPVFAGNAHNAQLLRSYSCILAKEFKFVADFDDEDGVQVLPFNIQVLLLHGCQLASTLPRGNTRLPLRSRFGSSISLRVFNVVPFGFCASRFLIDDPVAPLYLGYTVRPTQSLDELLVKLCLTFLRLFVILLILLVANRRTGKHILRSLLGRLWLLDLIGRNRD